MQARERAGQAHTAVICDIVCYILVLDIIVLYDITVVQYISGCDIVYDIPICVHYDIIVATIS